MENFIQNVESLAHFEELIEKEDAVLFYFSHEKCNVCKVLKPKIADLLQADFPKVKMFYSDTVNLPEVAGQNRVFTVPTVIVFFAGREYIRKSRSIGIGELGNELTRPYEMMF